MGDTWVHLRMCEECGHIGCCDQSKNRHATAHFHSTAHPIIRSFEPGEDWYYCYLDDLMFEIEGAPPALHTRRHAYRNFGITFSPQRRIVSSCWSWVSVPIWMRHITSSTAGFVEAFT